jgi:hypothetical protein
MDRLQPIKPKKGIAEAIPRAIAGWIRGCGKKAVFVTAITLGLEGEITSIG